MSGRLGRWLRWTVTALLLALVVRAVDLGSTAELLVRGSLPLLLLATAIALVDRLAMAAKWYPLLRVQVPEIDFATTVRAYFAATLAGRFLPTSVGSDVLRAVGLGAGRQKAPEVGVSIVLERLLGLASACLWALGAIALAVRRNPEAGSALPWALAALGATVLLGLAPFSPGLRALPRALYRRWPDLPGKAVLRRGDRAYAAYGNHGGRVLAVGAATLLEQLVPVVQFGILSVALGRYPGTETLLITVLLAMLVARLPIAVDGLGVLEGALVVFGGWYGMTPETALAVAVAFRIVGIVSALPGAFFWSDLTPGLSPTSEGGSPPRRTAGPPGDSGSGPGRRG